jgi:raffinose/stachyose/melibiose transport system permease protein
MAPVLYTIYGKRGHKMTKGLKIIKREIPYIVFILPSLVIFIAFMAYPALSTVYHSFTNWSDVLPVRYRVVGFRNYIRLFQDKTVGIGIRNSFIFAIFATLLQSAAGLALALVLNLKFKAKNILRSVWYFPAVLSSLVIGYLFNFILSTSDMGLINGLLVNVFGLAKVNFLGNPNTALISIILVSVWQWAGWTMTIYLANLQSIPNELYESAGIDGAGPVRRLFSVTLPMLFPAVSYTFITGMINGLKVFDIIYALTNGGPNGRTESIVSLMMKRGFAEGFFSYASTMGTVFLGIVLIITMFQMKFFNNWGDNIT